MTKNSILRKIKETFGFSHAGLVTIFAGAEHKVSEEDVVDWLRREEDPAYKPLYDDELAVFLNGLIIENRGKKEGPVPKPERILTNNIILKKLQIAFKLQADEIIGIWDTADVMVTKYELSAFMRKPDHKHYRPVRDRLLRDFLKGLRIVYHDSLE